MVRMSPSSRMRIPEPLRSSPSVSLLRALGSAFTFTPTTAFVAATSAA